MSDTNDTTEVERPDPATMFAGQSIFLIRPLGELHTEYHVPGVDEADARREFHRQRPGWAGTILSARPASDEVTEEWRERMETETAAIFARLDEQQALADSVTGGEEINWGGDL